MKNFALAASAALLAFSAISPNLHADELRKMWELVPDGSRTYIGDAGNERGIAYNPVTDHLLVVSRAGGVNIAVLDGATGDEVSFMDAIGIDGGTFDLSMIDVADDGVIYAANLTTGAATTPFKVYRWQDENSTWTVAYEGDPGEGVATSAGQRWGDSFDVRGAGANTQILIGARAIPSMAILTTTDGENFTSNLIPNAGASTGNTSVAFGAGDTAWLKINGQPFRRVSFNLAAKTATLLNSITAASAGMGPIGATEDYLGVIDVATPDSFTVYDIRDLSLGLITIHKENFTTDIANGNIVGTVEFGTNRVYALDAHNGIMAFEIIENVKPASIVSQPASVTGLEGATVSLSVAASGSLPLTFQWKFQGADIAGATKSTLSLTNIQAASAGEYTVVVSNSGGSVESDPATLTVTPLVRSDILTKKWQIAPGSGRAYVATDNNQRGIAYNPVTKNVILVSRTGGNNIYVLSGEDGSELGKLTIDPQVVTGGTFAINMVDVADDGAIYVANLVIDAATTAFAVYRWENDSADAVPVPVFVGDPSQAAESATNRRYGDTMAVRGSGENTQILIASRSGTYVSILTPTPGDPSTFLATAVNVTNAPAGSMGLGVTFGEGNTFWAKASGANGALRQISFPDPVANQGLVVDGEVINTIPVEKIPTTITSIGFDPANKLLAGNALENPDNLRLYNMSDLVTGPTLVDQEAFPADNTNGNGTGSVDFGQGFLVTLNSNNGIMAFTVDPNATPQPARANLAAGTLTGTTFTVTVTGTPNARYRVESSTNLQQWSAVEEVTIDADGSVTVTDNAASQQQKFYRAVAL